MDKPKSKFPTMETSAATGAKNASAEGTTKKLVKRGGAQAGDPTTQAKPARKEVKSTSGASHAIKTNMPAYKDPQVGPVQGNGRLFTAVMNRSKPNFDAGIVDHN